MSDYNSFNTIDHLVEFGMGIAIAQQMVSTMNHCIGNMKIPGAGNELTPNNPAPKYHILANDAVAGLYKFRRIHILAY